MRRGHERRLRRRIGNSRTGKVQKMMCLGARMMHVTRKIVDLAVKTMVMLVELAAKTMVMLRCNMAVACVECVFKYCLWLLLLVDFFCELLCVECL